MYFPFFADGATMKDINCSTRSRFQPNDLGRKRPPEAVSKLTHRKMSRTASTPLIDPEKGQMKAGAKWSLVRLAMNVDIFPHNRMWKCNSIPKARRIVRIFSTRRGCQVRVICYILYYFIPIGHSVCARSVQRAEQNEDTDAIQPCTHTATGTNTFTSTANNISRHCWKIKMSGTWFFNGKKINENHSKQPKWKSTETIGPIHSTHFSTHRRQHTRWNFLSVRLHLFFVFFLFSFCRFVGIDRSHSRKIYHNIPILLAEIGKEKNCWKILSPFSVRVYGVPVCECVLSKKKENGYGGDLYIFNKQTLVKTLKIILVFVFFFFKYIETFCDLM